MKKYYNNELIKVKHGSRFHKITYCYIIILIREVLKNNKKGQINTVFSVTTRNIEFMDNPAPPPIIIPLISETFKETNRSTQCCKEIKYCCLSRTCICIQSLTKGFVDVASKQSKVSCFLQKLAPKLQCPIHLRNILENNIYPLTPRLKKENNLHIKSRTLSLFCYLYFTCRK